MKLIAVAAVLALMVAVPAVARDAVAPAATANPTLRSVPVVLTARGKPHRYRVEVAATALEQNRGLMFRKLMPRGHGMIFPFAPAKPATFWMENTVLPLDLVFIAPDRTVLRVATGKPFARDILDSGGPVIAVLELNAGEAARIGLQPGDRIDYAL